MNAQAETLVARALECAAGFRALGNEFSAHFTLSLAENIEAAPECASLYANFIGQQEQRLAAKQAERMGKAA